MNLTGRLPIWLAHFSSSGAPEEDRVRLQTVRPAASPPAEPGSSSPVPDPGKGPAPLSEEEQHDRKFIRQKAFEALDAVDGDLIELVKGVERAAYDRYQVELRRLKDPTPGEKKQILHFIVVDECLKARNCSLPYDLRPLRSDPRVLLQANRVKYHRLPPEDQVIMALYERTESFRELAEILGRSVHAVKKQVTLLRNRLRAEEGQK